MKRLLIALASLLTAMALWQTASPELANGAQITSSQLCAKAFPKAKAARRTT